MSSVTPSADPLLAAQAALARIRGGAAQALTPARPTPDAEDARALRRAEAELTRAARTRADTQVQTGAQERTDTASAKTASGRAGASSNSGADFAALTEDARAAAAAGRSPFSAPPRPGSIIDLRV